MLLRRACRIANRELLKATHQKLEELNAIRTEPKHKNAKAYARWANKVWKENQDAPTVLVPYKGKVWVARMSHNQLDFFFAEGDLFDLNLFLTDTDRRLTLDICLTFPRCGANFLLLLFSHMSS